MTNKADKDGIHKDPLGSSNQIAPKYNYYRNLDRAPLRFLIETFPDHGRSICEIGSGTGRNLIPLVEKYQARGKEVEHAYGVDTRSSMLEQARQASESSGLRIDWIQGSSSQTGIPSHSVSLVIAFNVIHQLPLRETIIEMERIAEPGAVIGIYVRTREQERGHVWGLWFPGYVDHSTVPTRETMTSLDQHADNLVYVDEQEFRFQRKTSKKWILEQTRNKHYSTLARYPEEKFDQALGEFEENLKIHYPGKNRLEYTSAFTLFLYRSKSGVS